MPTDDMSEDAPGIEFVVRPDEVGQRVDKALAGRLPEESRSYLQELAKQGFVRVDDAVAPAKQKLARGQRVSCELAPRHRLRAGGDAPLPELRVLFEDEAILVVDKAAGVATHPSGGIRWGTLAQAAEAHVGAELPSSGEADRGGIVHRLDRFTSGVLVLAKTSAALEELQRQFRDREVEKIYLAIVRGEPRFASDWIEGRLERDPDRPERIRLVSRRALAEAEDSGTEPPGRAAQTFYETMERFGGHALLRCRPRTGRTHQIRVHLTSIDLPILGEHVYKGRRHQGRDLPPGAPPCDRHMLHAAELAFRHPVSGEEHRHRAELPADFAGMLRFLRSL